MKGGTPLPCRQSHSHTTTSGHTDDRHAPSGADTNEARGLRLGSIEWNRAMWGDPQRWEDGGDNWSFHAESCGQSYEQWKASVVATFVTPFCGPGIDVLELAPGHGRWTDYFVGNSATLTLVDLNDSCISVCRERFGARPEVRFVVNDGRSLPVPDASVDLVWSFGSFVHFVPADIETYLAEFRRVLRPGGTFVVHHTGWPDATLRFVPLTRRLGRPGRVLQHRLGQGLWRPGGDRVEMSAPRFSLMAARHGLIVDRHVRRWGDSGQFGLAFNDVVSVGSSPA